MKKWVYLGLSILDINNMAMKEYWYDYVKPKYEKMIKLGYINKEIFMVHVKSAEIYVDLLGDVVKRFDKSNNEVKRALPIGKKDRADER